MKISNTTYFRYNQNFKTTSSAKNASKNVSCATVSFCASTNAINKAIKFFEEYEGNYDISFGDYVNDEELNAICDFVKNNPQCAKFYWSNQQKTYFNNPKEKDDFLALTYTLLNDEQKLEVYSKMAATVNRFLLTPASILTILDNDTKITNTFFTEMLNRQVEDELKFKYLHSSDLINTLESLEKDTIIPYFDMVDYAWKNNEKLTYHPIENWLNPKTKKFDPNIAKLAIDLSNKVTTVHGRDFAKNCVDEVSGKISKPVVSLLNDIFAFEKSCNHNYVFSYGHNSTALSVFIDSIKDENGSFDKNNVEYARKLLAPILVDKKEFYPTHFINIASLIDLSKDDKGIIQKDKFDLIYQAVLDAQSYDTTSNVLKPLHKCKNKEQLKLLNLLFRYLPKKGIINESFSSLAKFCIDNNGELVRTNIEFVKKLSTLDREFYSKSFLNLAKTYPQHRDFLFELLNNPYFNALADFQIDFIDLFIDKKGEILTENKNRLNAFLEKYGNIDEFSRLYMQCRIIKDDKQVGFDDNLFNSVLEIVPALKNEKYQFIDTTIIAQIFKGDFDVENLSFKDKNALCADILKIQNKLNNPSIFLNVINDINDSIISHVKPLEVSLEAKFDFIKDILSSKNSEFTPFEEKLVSQISYFENMQSGLKLKYTRHEFMSDLAKNCQEEFLPICKKLNITPNENNSYNGLIQLDKLDKNNPIEAKAYMLAHKFMYENAFETGDCELDYYLNKIISAMPEFINIVDKKQHLSQKYSLDIHILLALAYALDNPNYFDKLNFKDRAVLKFSILFHDISKQESINDKTHPQVGASWMKNISSKIFATQDMQNRVYEFILNHHWSTIFNVSDKTRVIKELAFKFRRPNDFEMAKIMARADMMAVSQSIYNMYGACLEDVGISQIEKTIDFYNANGNVLMSHKIVQPSKLKQHLVDYSGKVFPLINLHTLQDDDLVDVFGFSYGLKKKDLKFLVHMVDEKDLFKNLESISFLTNPMNNGVLSESLITPSCSATFDNRKFGVLLSSENSNLISMMDRNCASGTKKGFFDVIESVFNGGTYRRRMFKENLLFYLPIEKEDISDIEFAEFYKKYLSNLNSFAQIDKNKEYKLGKVSISGEILINALKLAVDELINKNKNTHNEIVSYSPVLEGVIAKVKTLDEVPNELINFAQENNLPVILI